MRKKLWIVALALGILTLLAGCGCKHEWNAATCTAPKTCVLCNETQGEALGHNWEAATCVLPEKCATCHETRGAVLEHNWEDATTEAPKTCTNCQATEGSKIITDPRFTTASTKEFYGKWTCEVVYTGEMMGTTGYLDEMPCTLHYEFNNKGDCIRRVEVHDALAYLDAVKKMTRDITLQSLALQGINESQADAAMKAVYGMTLEEFVNAYVDSIDPDDIFGESVMNGVYYVGQNGLYMSNSWLGEFECSEYTLENGVLIIQEDVLVEGGEPLQWTRVEEK